MATDTELEQWVKHDMVTADDPAVDLCTLIDGTNHDFRPYDWQAYPGAPWSKSLRCVWCHGVACGEVLAPDPCTRVYHHEPLPHLTAAGVTWPIGGNRPE